MEKIITLILTIGLTWNATAQDFALKQLEDSPRHHEWVKVQYGKRTVHSFVAYPEKSGKATAVIVIHENRGLTDWVRSMADQLAAEGYLAIAPDLLSEFDDQNQKTSDFASSDDARNAIYQLDPDRVTNDLHAVREYISSAPSCNGKVAVMGFCWGGSQTFRFATNSSEIVAALVFYGGGPSQQADIDRIQVPVYGFYGENDERVNAGIAGIEEKMKKAGKVYDYHIYPGAGHAYMRRGDDPEEPVKENITAKDESWVRIRKILAGVK